MHKKRKEVCARKKCLMGVVINSIERRFVLKLGGICCSLMFFFGFKFSKQINFPFGLGLW